ncbi:MAG: hypothetical protein Q8N06_02915 [Hydrogenophaga sp.]|nr:hypothetical protein [Hydrogenophaga sp.]
MTALPITKIAPGVVRSFDGARAIYYGSAEHLVAAGVVEPHQLPVPPGPRKCVINFDGYLAQAGTIAKRPGQKQVIAKTSPKGTRYEVRVVLAEHERQALSAGPAGKLRPRIGGDEPQPRLVRTHAWPFPNSYGRALEACA